MKNQLKQLFIALVLLSTLNLQLSTFAQGTAFTYQGRLVSGGVPASGTYNLTFTLFNNTNVGVLPVAGPVTNNGVPVANGLFTVTIDFGSNVWNGATNWLEIGVETNGVNSFTTLTPSQQLTPVPYAIFAESSSNLLGALPASQLTSISGGYDNFFVGPSGNSTTSGSYNTANGVYALSNNTSGSDNTANGFYALVNNTSGSDNTANGSQALVSNTGGSGNTANGSQALAENTSGSGNTANGFDALFFNTIGGDNTANGLQALQNNTSGSYNTANGAYALVYNTSGSENTANGFFALYNNITGGGNTANGYQVLYSNTNGFENTANGLQALQSNTSGSDNTVNGAYALLVSTSGSDNTVDGAYALLNNTSGSDNMADGYQALYNNRSGNNNTAIGVNALQYLGSNGAGGTNNVALGFQAGYYLSGNESGNIEIGNQGFAGDNNTIRIGDPNVQTNTFVAGVINGNGGGLTNLNINASQLTSIGNTNVGAYGNFFVGPSGNSTMTGFGNTANGYNALGENTSGFNNTANGNGALLNNENGYADTANGANALYFNTSGINNTANGANALFSNTSGFDNTANGVDALYYNTNGSGNTANGFNALLQNVSGDDNTANGAGALYYNTNGINNTADGYIALYNVNGSDNIALGYQAGENITSGSFNIDIGNQGFSTDTNIIRIGSGQTSTFIAGVINGNGGGLTNLNASQLASGIIPLAHLPGAVVTNNNVTGVTLSGKFNGNGGGLTNLNVSAAQLTGGANNNFFVGPSGNSTTSGSDNTANGGVALVGNTSGSDNTANGYYALANNTSGSDNTADGALALLDNISGSGNIALGYLAGDQITTGSSNIDIGNQGFSTDTNLIRIGTGQTSTFIAGVINGNGGGLTNLNASQLTSIGNANGGAGNFFVGQSGTSYTSGFDNTANGAFAFENNTSGSDNTANGFNALNDNTTGNFNTANGYQALYFNSIGSGNIAMGYQAGYNLTTGSSNIDIGNTGLATDTNIIRIGTSQAATYLAGTVHANGGGLTNLNASQLFSIGNNNFYAGSAGNAANTGSDNTAMGTGALTNNTSGTGNTAFGFGALQSATGNFNFGYGYLAGSGLTTGANNVDIAAAGQSGDNAIIRIGTPGIQTATYLAGNVYASGAVFSNGVDVVSDRNAKEDFRPLNSQAVLAKVAGLPITEWNYKTTKNMEHIGPMAQDFHAAFGLNGPDDKHISVVDEGGVALAAIQGLNQKVEEKEARIQEQATELQTLKQQNDLLAERLNELEATVKQLAANQ